MASKLIIAAISARGYAQAAVTSGYRVITIDAFADADTQIFSEQCFQVRMNASGVDVDDFKRIFSHINLDEVAGFLYGSLFDGAADLLAWVAKQVPLVGNVPEVMQLAKSFAFFGVLDALNVKHPEVYLFENIPLSLLQDSQKFIEKVGQNSCLHENNEARSCGKSWLLKQLGGTGGAHVKHISRGSSGDYIQRKIEGVPVSMLFVADGTTPQLIGFNEQLIAPTAEMSYRFAGAVSHYPLPQAAQQAFETVAQQLTKKLALRGCNSLDAVFDGENVWILELNPRLSTTFHLYPNLLQAHLQGCAGNLVALQIFKNVYAHWILYAEQAIEIFADFTWPIWVTDIPKLEAGASSVKFVQDAPICTVLAHAENAETAKELVLQRAEILRKMLLK